MSFSPTNSSTGKTRRLRLIFGLVGLGGLILGLIFAISQIESDTPELQTVEIVESKLEPISPLPPEEDPPATNIIAEPALAELLDEYMTPGRMVFFEIQLSSDGAVVVQQARGAIGRAKLAPLRNSPGFVRIDSYDQDGELAFSQTVEDPTHRIIEHPANSDDGRIATTIARQDIGSLFVRIPGESLASRLVLSRWTRPESASSPFWHPFATINLPSI